jgi:hypothetical protein
MAYKTIDYVLAFPEAPVEREIFMNIPRGFKIDEGNTKDFVLKLHRNIYGQSLADALVSPQPLYDHGKMSYHGIGPQTTTAASCN